MSETLQHDEAFELLPWFVNGTLSTAEHDAVERHVRSCLPCRKALQEQHRLQALIQDQPTVRLSPEADFADLMREVDGPPRSGLGAALQGWRRGLTRRLAPAPRRAATIGMLVASFALAAWLITFERAGPGDGAYSTSSEKAASSGALVDLVFADDVTETEMRALVREIGGTIVSGPSDIGRYTIELTSPAADEAARAALLERLQRDPRVRFAGRAFIEDAAP